MKRFSIRQLIAEADGETTGFYRHCGFQVKSLGTQTNGRERFRCEHSDVLDQALQIVNLLGIVASRSDLVLDQREKRIMIHVPGNMMLIFPTCDEGRCIQQRERNILNRLTDRATFAVPCVEKVAEDESWELRKKVPGVNGITIYERLLIDDNLAQRTAITAGRILGELHSIFHETEAQTLGTHPIFWVPLDVIREKLARYLPDEYLKAQIYCLIDKINDIEVSKEDLVFLHGDFGVHNMALNPESLELNGIFDFEEASFGDRHWDLKYLYSYSETFISNLLHEYQEVTGVTLSKDKLVLYHALTATAFLANRIDQPAGDYICGRTLEQDLRWTNEAVRRAWSIYGTSDS